MPDARKRARLQGAVRIGHFAFDGEGARFQVDVRADASDPPLDRTIGVGIDADAERLPDADGRREPFRDLGRQPQRMQTDDTHHRRLHADELAGRDEPFGDHALEGCADDGVLQLAVGALERRLAGGDLCQEVAGGGERGLVGRAGGLELGFGAFEVLGRQQVPGGELPGAREPLVLLRCGGAIALITSGVCSGAGSSSPRAPSRARVWFRAARCSSAR